jgi:hypothetical protein
VIVQTAPAGQSPAIIAQLEHSRFAGRLAAAWGNQEFAPLSPRELMEYTVVHHDDGWEAVDANVGRVAETGLPWSLVTTPVPELVKSSARGSERNERAHPYCGLLSSMHSYGLYHGRYGLSDKVFVHAIPPKDRPAVDDMLAGEVARQARLKALLASDRATAPWVEDAALFHNYKLLQFFDTLALYFNCTHEAARGAARFSNVPRGVGDDVTVTVSRIDASVYRVAPFPFAENVLAIACEQRRLAPQPEGTNLVRALAAAPVERETVRLIA